MDNEPLSDWAKRRDAKIGRLRAVPLVPGDGPKGSHLNPEAPRAIQRWNGYAWEPYGTAAKPGRDRTPPAPARRGTADGDVPAASAPASRPGQAP
ncbi:DUF6087 family protein [Streptomyces microflavus]